MHYARLSEECYPKTFPQLLPKHIPRIFQTQYAKLLTQPKPHIFSHLLNLPKPHIHYQSSLNPLSHQQRIWQFLICITTHITPQIH
ncbi:PAS domain-containing protein, partial [Bacillus thuringiensis]|uniref:PAS domain-containing protein n=1 Tax=Bacillus thuringiensis TaxID=1428 RepID=UPI003D6CB488